LFTDLTTPPNRPVLKSSNTLTGYVIGVLIVWAVIFVVGYFLKGSTPGHPALHVFGGFLLGMLSMYAMGGCTGKGRATSRATNRA
jgi:hypothetical protein